MSLPDFQPNLISSQVVANLDRIQNTPGLLITVDRTPAYDLTYQMDQFRKTLNPIKTFYYEPTEALTPLDLLMPVDEIKYMRILGNTHQRFIEGVLGKTEPSNTNIIVTTPLSTLAMFLYAKVVGSRFSPKDISTTINFQSALLKHFAKNIRHVDSINIVQRVPFGIIVKNIPNIGITESETLNKRVQIYNGCLSTAARITSRVIGKQYSVV